MKEPPKYNFWYFDISIVGLGGGAGSSRCRGGATIERILGTSPSQRFGPGQ